MWAKSDLHDAPSPTPFGVLGPSSAWPGARYQLRMGTESKIAVPGDLFDQPQRIRGRFARLWANELLRSVLKAFLFRLVTLR